MDVIISKLKGLNTGSLTILVAAILAGAWVAVTNSWLLGLMIMGSGPAVLGLRRLRWFDPTDDVGLLARRMARASAKLQAGEISAERSPAFAEGRNDLMGIATKGPYSGRSVVAFKDEYKPSYFQILIRKSFFGDETLDQLGFESLDLISKFVEENGVLWIDP